MAVVLTKPSNVEGLPNRTAIACPRCRQNYVFACSDDEWNRLTDWVAVARRALRDDHKCRQEQPSIPLRWNAVRGV
jgi:hypothetical protein